MNLSRTRLDWDVDVTKHYVRREAWLPAAIEQVEASRQSGREPKYLTFCAANAIDVFLFLKEGVISRDEQTDVVQNTYFCEKFPEEFNEISQLIGAHEQGFLGDFNDIVLFEDDEDTQGLDYDDTAQLYPRDLRRRLDTKKKHQRFRNAGPFDVLNLDIFGTFFPPRGGVESPMLRSIRTLLEIQSASSVDDDPGVDSFTLFLTAHMEPGRVNEDAMRELVQMVESNGDTYAGFAQELSERFGTDVAKEIAENDFEGFYCVALPKVIVSEAFNRGWRTEVKFAGKHRRVRSTSSGELTSTYAMLSWVGRFDRFELDESRLGRRTERQYAQSILELIEEPEDVDSAVSKVKDEVEADLSSVVCLRNRHQSDIRSR